MRLAQADRHRPGARRRGYDTRWEKYRAGYLAAHPTCAVCGAEATVVDHIQPVALGGGFWDSANHQPLCRSHHSAKTMRELMEVRWAK